MISFTKDYITYQATEKVNKALETIILTEEWKSLEEYVFVKLFEVRILCCARIVMQAW